MLLFKSIDVEMVIVLLSKKEKSCQMITNDIIKIIMTLSHNHQSLYNISPFFSIMLPKGITTENIRENKMIPTHLKLINF